MIRKNYFEEDKRIKKIAMEIARENSIVTIPLLKKKAGIHYHLAMKKLFELEVEGFLVSVVLNPGSNNAHRIWKVSEKIKKHFMDED